MYIYMTTIRDKYSHDHRVCINRNKDTVITMVYRIIGIWTGFWVGVIHSRVRVIGL